MELIYQHLRVDDTTMNREEQILTNRLLELAEHAYQRGIPMYSNAAGVMPLIEVLTAKGMLLGTALSFMMAITALSLPEAMILKRILHVKLIATFFGIVSLGIMGVGYLFNAIL